MNWLAKLFSRSDKTSTRAESGVFPSLWEESKPNPTIVAKVENSAVIFVCPTCGSRVSVPLHKIDERRGALWSCGMCPDHFYISGQGNKLQSADAFEITSGILIAIKDFSNWYLHHPVYSTLGEETWMLNEHGIWAFCAACRRQFISTVLCSLVTYQLSSSIGLKGYVFGANTSESAQEMEALQSNRCQRCGSSGLIAIMAEIPKHIRDSLRH